MQDNITTKNVFFKLILGLFIICNLFLLKNILFGLHEEFNFAILFLGCCIFFPLLLNIKKKDFFLFDPKNILPLWFSLMYYITSIPIYSVVNPSEFFSTLIFNPLNKDNLTVYYILSFGILLFYFGYNITNVILKQRNKINFGMNVKNILKYKVVFLNFYLFSIFFRFIGYYMGFMGSLSALNGNSNIPNVPFISIFYFVANSWIIYFFYFSCLSFYSKKNKNLFIILLCFELLFMLLGGNRRELIILLFLYFLAFYLVKSYLPIVKNLKYLIPLLIFVLPFITIYGYLLPYLENYDISSLIGLVSQTFNKITSLDFYVMFLDFFLNPILESFNYFSNVGIAYTEFTQKGIYWGPVGLVNLANKLIPSFIYSTSFDERIYFQLFSEKAMSYRIEYSNLTFTAQTEQMLGFGIYGILVGMFLQGVTSSFLFRKFNSIKTPFFLRVVYLGLLYKFTINFNSGLLVSDLILAFRLLFYAFIIHVIYRMLIKN